MQLVNFLKYFSMTTDTKLKYTVANYSKRSFIYIYIADYTPQCKHPAF